MTDQASIDAPAPATGLTRSRFVAAMVLVLLVAAALRSMFPLADPPWQSTVGVVWHDEGAWTHNARNRALFGVWTLDEWNPMYLAPVFTGLEYVSFAALNVGLWQARLVSELSGWISVFLLGLGVARIANREAGLIAAALLAANYVYVTWNRAALMETTMISFMVVSWYCYARAERSPMWGLFAGLTALLAFFTKAAAAFYVAALGLDAVLTVIWGTAAQGSTGSPSGEDLSRGRYRAAMYTLFGFGAGGAIAAVAFVGPYWNEFLFYNWQMSVTRKPSYTLKAFVDRASWLPIVHDFFTRMWLTAILAGAALISRLPRWRTRPPAVRLFMLWIGFGVAELILHDVGNERRLIFLIPALVGLAALLLGSDRRLLPQGVAELPRARALLAAPVLLYLLYVLIGAVVRLAFLYETRPGVRIAALLATLLGSAIYLTWPRIPAWLSAQRWSATAAAGLAIVTIVGDLGQFGQWAAERTYKNYDAMRSVALWLPPGTAVHGKLANGLALENRIRPVFVGREFGNYVDRQTRDDVRYVLTYVAPSLGYEGPVITEVLAAYPHWKILRTFEVAETAGGHDFAVLIEKGERGPATTSIPPATSVPATPVKGSSAQD